MVACFVRGPWEISTRVRPAGKRGLNQNSGEYVAAGCVGQHGRRESPRQRRETENNHKSKAYRHRSLDNTELMSPETVGDTLPAAGAQTQT